MEWLPERLLVGVSGGADSVALLLMLLEAGKTVTAAHVNHGLRGERSDGDEAFVRALCGERNVPLLVYRAQPPLHPSEDWARRTRYAFLRDAMERSGAQALAIAHHQDDQAETLLLHLLRGAGLTGLCAMKRDVQAEGMRIVRPLLDTPRQALRDYLLAQGQPWREDDSNADPRYLRNALRGEILPRLEALAPGAAGRMAAAAALLQQEEETLQALTERLLDQHGGECLPLDALTGQPQGLQARVLRAWWQRSAPGGQERSLSLKQTEALRALVTSPAGTQCNLPGGWHGYRGWTHVHLLPPEERAQAAEQPVRDGARIGRITLELRPFTGDPGDGRRAQAIPASMLPGLTLRTRRAGDWIRPFGSEGKQSLQDYFVNRRLDAPFRELAPLICRGSELLLAAGLGAGNIPRAEDKSECVMLCWTGDMPWHRTK